MTGRIGKLAVEITNPQFCFRLRFEHVQRSNRSMLSENNYSPYLYVAREGWMRYGGLQLHQHADIRRSTFERLEACITGQQVMFVWNRKMIIIAHD